VLNLHCFLLFFSIGLITFDGKSLEILNILHYNKKLSACHFIDHMMKQCDMFLNFGKFILE